MGMFLLHWILLLITVEDSGRKNRIMEIDEKTAIMRNEAAALELETARIRYDYSKAMGISPFVLTEETVKEIIKQGAENASKKGD